MIIPNSKLEHKANNLKTNMCGNNILKVDTVKYLALQSD